MINSITLGPRHLERATAPEMPAFHSGSRRGRILARGRSATFAMTLTWRGDPLDRLRDTCAKGERLEPDFNKGGVGGIENLGRLIGKMATGHNITAVLTIVKTVMPLNSGYHCSPFANYTLNGIKAVLVFTMSSRTGGPSAYWDSHVSSALSHTAFQPFTWPVMFGTSATYVDVKVFNGIEVLFHWVFRVYRSDSDRSVQQQFCDEVRGVDSAISNKINQHGGHDRGYLISLCRAGFSMKRGAITGNGVSSHSKIWLGKVAFFVMVGHSFGLFSAVYNYNRRSAAINDILRRVFTVAACQHLQQVAPSAAVRTGAPVGNDMAAQSRDLNFPTPTIENLGRSADRQNGHGSHHHGCSYDREN
ncbi:unnamed protein product [Symbiodinium sp. KB8]|nr:unnamed protein product [Symbiodinium sp. KB8]